MLFELAHLIDALPGLAWTALPDGCVDLLNRRWLDYTGLTAEQAADQGWIETIHPDDRESVGDYWRSCVISGISGDTEARMRRHDDAYRGSCFGPIPFATRRETSPDGLEPISTSKTADAVRRRCNPTNAICA
jgi:PAS domain-containing protein